MSESNSAPRMTKVEYDPFASPDLARAVPTTEAQREIWFADQLGRDASLAYNESISLQIRGPLAIQALQDALLALADRHEALRSTLSGDGLSLLIAPRGSLRAQLVDLSAQREEARVATLDELRSTAVETPFDLVNGPLFRCDLIRLAAECHELIVTGHHIVCDGWSFGVIATELISLYATISSGTSERTLPFADSYGDHALEQAGDDYRAVAEANTRWWVQCFDDARPVLELPVDRPRQAQRGFASLREDVVIDAALADGVRRLGARCGASLFVTLFATFGALMGRLAGQNDVVVGVPAAGQSASGKSALVGHCVQLLPIRVAADLDQPFAALVAGTRTRVLDAYDHQACTYGSLLKKLQVQRDPSRLPLVSVLFNLDAAIRSEDLSLAGLSVELRSNPRHFENFDLFLNASQVGTEIVLECQYNTGLFDAGSVRRWLLLYREALARLVQEPNQTTAQAFSPTADDLALLARFNATASAHSRERRVDELVTAQAAATPDAIAVVAGDLRMTYRELDERANALARDLRRRGTGTGDLVGLYCGRNEHMMVGLLGILKAGAGYIPMDPAFPADRLEYMSSDAKANFIVSDRSVEGAWNFSRAQRVAIDELGRLAEAQQPAGSADDVAYVIYTSGSTGRPKGVRVPHRTVTNLLASVTREPGMVASNVVLSVTTLSFDIAVSEVILPLTVGASVVVADRSQATDGDRLRELIERERVDFIDATPSTWRLLLAAGWRGGPLLKAICTGEPLPPDLGRELLPRVGELWNGYGPTETTVWSSFHRVLVADGPVPIGHPVANTEIHVVDEKLRPVPVGVVGELFIGGEGVTLGYLGRDDLTAERFLPDPFRPGSRWYKTGDLGRWRADGVLECLGRSDHQVKVRGYRIELGEIEANLTRHPDIDRAVVVTREDDPGDVRLVAYAVSRGPALDAAALRDFLRRSLPEYMIPSHVMQLDAIPLLPNGKIDRKSLPRPETQLDGARADHVAPRTPIEAQLLEAMEQVLNLPGLGVRDDFFAFGGHSLLAAKLTARLNKELGLSLPLRTIFEVPTVEGLARAVEAARGTAAAPRRGVERRSDQGVAPLTVMQERIRFMEQLHPGRVVYNTPSAHRLSGPFDRQAFESAFNRMLQRQPSLRTFIAQDASGPVQRVLPNLAYRLGFDDLSTLPQAEREPELMRRMQVIIDRPIPIGEAPLFHAGLYRMSSQEHVFLFMPHHIIWDGWSFDLLYEEMAALYPAALSGTPAVLPPPATSYVDYAHWHAQWMQGEECRAQMQYWKQRYAGIDAPRGLPTDHSRGAGMTGAGAVEWVHVDKALTERLRRVALASGATLNMLTMAVYAAMIGEAIGSSSLVVGVPVRGRLSSEVESVMGFFNNLLPVHLRVESERSFPEWLSALKRELLDAFANQEVPFERLATEPEIARHAHRAGLYQSLFSFQDARERQRRWGPLAHASVLVMQKGATEDFGLWLMEVPGGLEGGINYNADLFDAATARIFRDRFVGLLRRLAHAPDRTVDGLLADEGADAVAYTAWVRSRQSPERRPAPVAAPTPPALDAREVRMAAIWASLLGIEAGQISPLDNFFDLGGNSLLVMQAVASAEREFGVTIDPRRLVYESLGKLAAAGTAEASKATSAPDRRRDGLARLWAGLLGIDVEQIQSGDNFFDLGGNSLLAMRAVSESKRQLGLTVDPRRYVYETLEQLCATAPTADAAEAIEAVAIAAETAPATGGLLSRVLGRFGRRP
jgi:amino acid adenylation domain-containing protein